MKKTKIIPATLLVACALTSCGGNKTPTTVKEFVANLKDGEVSKEEVNKLYKGTLLETADNGVKFGTFNEKDYAPRDAFGDLTEEECYLYVHNLDRTLTYKLYDNNIIVTDTNYSCYDYDPNAKDPNEGLAEDPTLHKDKAYIYKDGDDLRYTYIYDNDKTDDLSFSQKGVENDLTKKWFTSGGGLTNDLSALVSNYQEYVDLFASWGYTSTETFSANKANGELHVLQNAKVNIMDLYSAERIWGYEDYEEEEPQQRTELADVFAGCYVDRSLKIKYEYTIKDGFIQDFTYYGYVYSTVLYKDKNWTKGQKLPSYPLTEEELAALDLYIPDTLPYGDKEIDNPYKGIGYDDYLPFYVCTFTTNGTSLGNYDTTKIPDATGMREARSTDHGNWFDVQDMIE